jgi:flagellar biosynthesis protein FliR
MLTGFFALVLLMSNIGPVFHNLFERSFDAVPLLLEALTPVTDPAGSGP